jgi:SAM-dependent methyltransferase
MINFGCGSKRLSGWLNIDRRKEVADKVLDLDTSPYPFKSDTADKVNSDNVLEHLQKRSQVIGEFHRILKTGRSCIVKVPRFTCGGPLNGDNHIRAFGVDFFYNFERGERDNYAAGVEFTMVECKIIFPHRFQFWNYPLEWLANINRATQRFYEHSFLRILPAEQIDVKMIK